MQPIKTNCGYIAKEIGPNSLIPYCLKFPANLRTQNENLKNDGGKNSKNMKILNNSDPFH